MPRHSAGLAAEQTGVLHYCYQDKLVPKETQVCLNTMHIVLTGMETYQEDWVDLSYLMETFNFGTGPKFGTLL